MNSHLSVVGLLLVKGLALSQGCGESIEERIVGGDPVTPHSVPWQVGLVPKGSPNFIFCGGTIICSKYIMTAAHCIQNTNEGSIQVLAGEHSTQIDNDHATKHDIQTIIAHPDYDAFTLDNDYAILELKEPIVLTGISKARAACLPSTDDTDFSTSTSFTVSGWGALQQNGGSPDVLHSVQVPWVSDAACSSSDVYGSQITDNMICAGNIDEGLVDSCQGDSGGPLTWVDPTTSKVKLIGVVSWGAGCAQAGFPGVYAEVSSALTWVKGIIGNCAAVEPPSGTTENPGTTQAPVTSTQVPVTSTQAPVTSTQVPVTSTEEPGTPSTEEPGTPSTEEPGTPSTEDPEPTWQPSTENPSTPAGGCEVPQWAGDQYCDDGNNNAECNWDGGDCCGNYKTGWDNYCIDCECLDPDFEAPEEGCEDSSWVDDDFCDDGNNNAGCNWDGGDCCNNFKNGWDKYCDDCQCLDPNPPCEDQWTPRRCNRIQSQGRCEKPWAMAKCTKTCDACIHS